MTQLGFVAILLGLGSCCPRRGGDVRRVRPACPRVSGARAAVFVLTLAGFGSKAGLLPLHAWLPRAHPEAPSPVSALMSAAMVNLGIYGIIRIDLQLLGPGPRWWGVTVADRSGGVARCTGCCRRRWPPTSSGCWPTRPTENMGLITLALGAATLLRCLRAPHRGRDRDGRGAAAPGRPRRVQDVSAFLAAGSVLAATGLRDLDRLGGLARRMPATTVLFGVAALGASGLPLGRGFVSEWLLLQSPDPRPAGRRHRCSPWPCRWRSARSR